ncbi:MAG: hypothetical protein QOK23_954 [Gammaproteobacteria bacterium]|nr:hypothetical protein [Gammaproteobacteria bacterium]
MNTDNDALYDEMASTYHLIFEDWQEAIDRQGAIISRLVGNPTTVGPVLDCACGIGTQVLGLASAGYAVEGSDLSAAAIHRATAEAAIRHLQIDFRIDDMRTLTTAQPKRFGAVLAFDNALPHLESERDILLALAAIRDRLRSGGKLIISLRDYGLLMLERPTTLPPRFFGSAENRRIVHQIWDWKDERRYVVHIFITAHAPNPGWTTHHYTGQYRAITLSEISALMHKVGFAHVEVLQAEETQYYQPIVSAVRV